MPIGPLELGIILLIVIVIFGPKRLPKLGQSLGSGMREFRDSVRSRTGRDVGEEEEQAGALHAAEPAAPDPQDRVAGEAPERETERDTAPR